MSNAGASQLTVFISALADQRQSEELSQIAAQATSLSELIQGLKSIADPKVRGRAQYALLRAAEGVVARVEVALDETLRWVETDAVWRGLTSHGATLEDEFPSVARAAESGRKRRDNIASYIRTIRANWPEYDSYPVIASMTTVENLARAMRELSQAHKFTVAIQRLNAAVLRRLDTTKKGVRKLKAVMAADYRLAASNETLNTDPDAMAARARVHGLRLNEAGLYAERPLIEPVEDEEGEEEQSTLVATTRPRSDSNRSYRSHRSASITSQPSPPGGRSRSGSAASPPQPPSRPVTRSQHLPPVVPLDFSRPVPSHGRTHSQGTPPRAVEQGIIQRPRRTPSTSLATPLPRSGSMPSVLSDLTELSLEAIRPTLDKQGCRCDRDRASPRIVGHFIMVDDGIYNPLSSEREQLDMIREFATSIGRASSVPNARTQIYCYKHTRVLAQAVGLRVNAQNHDSLATRLMSIHDSMSRNRQTTFAQFKTRQDRYTWFIRSARGAVPSDELGPYRFFPRPVSGAYFRELSPNVFAAVAKALSLSNPTRDAWKADGTLNIPDFFAYWKTEGLLAQFKTEFDMYDWHLRRISDKPNFGWLRSMVYSLAQQVMRQDPGYWLLYGLLRPDHCLWLVSYPYYAKYQRKGDATAFRHIDLNVPKMADGIGVSQIQGTVSLDDERDNDCTILVPGMHHHIAEWSKRNAARKEFKSGFIHKITDKNLTSQDLNDFDTDWKAVPCPALGVRVTRPEIPHGAQMAQGVRRTMLPWYVAIQPDHERLEIPEAGVWEDLARSHRDLVAPPRSPSGHANIYGAIPYAFPAAVQLPSVGGICDALVGRQKWSSATVMVEIGDLLLPTDKEGRPLSTDQHAALIAKYLKTKRSQLAAAAKQAWAQVQQLEARRYATEKSFFQQGKNPRRRPAPDEAAADRDDTPEPNESAINLEEPS
jgi:hypothetical protein